MLNWTKYLLILPFLLNSFLNSGQNQNMLKQFLTVEEGLSHNEVTSIVQDNDGFIWIGTRGGLNRYDGYEFKVFNQVPGDSNSLVNPSIESLFVDSKGNIWIGTKSGGVSKFNPVSGTFKNFVSNYKKSNNILPANRVLSFFEDKKGRIWMGTWQNGVIVYDEKNNTSEQYLSGIVNSIAESSDGTIWVGTNQALFGFNEKDNTFTQYKTSGCQKLVFDNKRNAIWIVGGSSPGLTKFDLRNHKTKRYFIDNSIPELKNILRAYESVSIDNKNDRLWLGTWGTGLFYFDLKTEQFKRYLIYPENRQTLNKDYDTILDIFLDKDNNIWLGTNGGGVCVLSKKLNFNTVGYHPESGKGLTNTRLMSVLEDSKGNLWLGTIGSGLFWSPDRENFYRVKFKQSLKSQFFVIKYLFEDSSGKIWAGSNKGTLLVNFKNKIPELIPAQKSFRNYNFRNQTVSFNEDNDFFYLGTLQHGLYLLDKNNNYKTVKHLTKRNKQAGNLNSNRISYLLKDSKERIWVGTYNGLHIFNKKDTTVNLVESTFELSGEFTGNIITCIDEDQKGDIWVGTPNGVNKITQTGENKLNVEYFTENDGLTSNFIKGISHDLSGNIWLSTNTGISKLNLEDEIRVINFDETDGVLGKNFTEASVFRNKNGEIFFGGTFGLTYFLPDEIVEQQTSPKPVFTSLSILNENIEIGKKYNSKVILEKAINKVDKIELSYRQDNIEIQFSALDFDSNRKNQYKYLLEGHDEKWVNIGTRRFIILHNLKPDSYVLRVKSSNRHNVWNNEEAKIGIVINPPFWQTWYALLFYIVLITGIVSVIRWNAVKQVRLANNLKIEKLQHEQDQKLSEIKMRFFTNISHEFRTPLTLILAPLKELINRKEAYKLSDEAANKIGIVQNNSLRLMKLINQLLDFRKVESGNSKLVVRQTNLTEFISEICFSFQELADINNIKFKYTSALKTEKIWFDHDKLEVVVNNLISNAFKYVNENGKVEVALFEEEEEVLISVSDNGPGIPPTEINQIFNRFYRVGESEKMEGTGIGLALSKRYTELQKGTLTVTSTPNEYTEFVVSLLKGDNHFTDEEKAAEDDNVYRFIREEPIFSGILPGKTKAKKLSGDCILIVEDNEEVKAYLKELLEPLYCVELAANGLEGYKKAAELKPDLIISDVMMPVMDGFEFCRKIRSNDTTSTTPFIFLTAKSDEQFRLLGTRIGADDFLSKPFDPALLLEKVNNILTRHKKLQKKLSKSIWLEPSEIEITSADELFIEKVISIIEKNLQNHKFTSEVLASELNMSNSSLYRKLKGLTNSSSAEFIRSIRIKRAAQFLADKEKTITEIAYEVGFNDVKHFRTVFQKHFTCTPSEYRKKL